MITFYYEFVKKKKSDGEVVEYKHRKCTDFDSFADVFDFVKLKHFMKDKYATGDFYYSVIVTSRKYQFDKNSGSKNWFPDITKERMYINNNEIQVAKYV